MKKFWIIVLISTHFFIGFGQTFNLTDTLFQTASVYNPKQPIKFVLAIETIHSESYP